VTSVAIEPARKEHLAVIPLIELDAARLFPEADLPQSVRHRVTAVAGLQEALEYGRLWVAVADNKSAVGFAMAEIVAGQAYLNELGVLQAYGRQGIGSRLVANVIDWAGQAGFRHLSLITFRHLPWNALFYEKLGFSVLDAAEHGAEIAGRIEDEGRAGINIADRVAMRMDL